MNDFTSTTFVLELVRLVPIKNNTEKYFVPVPRMLSVTVIFRSAWAPYSVTSADFTFPLSDPLIRFFV